MTIKKAAIYARVSGSRQREEETIDSQVDAMRCYAKEQGYCVPENWVFLDDGVTGKTLQRPGLDELRDMICTESLDAILIYSPDRLARSYPHQLILLEEFRKRGVKVRFLKGSPPADTPEAIMFTHFQGIFAEYERALILDRSRRGRVYKAKKGDPAALPSLPHGYQKVKSGRTTSVEVQEEAANIVKIIYRLYIYDKLSLSKIARVLSEKELKTPKGHSRWDRATVRDILRNPAYTGTAYYGKTERIDGIPGKIRHYGSKKYVQPKHARRKTPEDRWLPISIPPIISESDFELAQEQIKKNRVHAARNTKEPAILQGLVICGLCGFPCYKRFRRTKKGIRGIYYCRSQTDSRITKCSNRQIPQEELDKLVYQEVVNLLQNPSLVQEELFRREKEAPHGEEAARHEISLKKELIRLSQERDRLLDAYQVGSVDLKELGKRNQGLDSRRNGLEREIRAIQAFKMNREKDSDLKRAFDDILERMKLSADELSIKERQKLVRLLVEQVVVDRENIRIVHCVSPRVAAGEFCQLSRDGGPKPTVTESVGRRNCG